METVVGGGVVRVDYGISAAMRINSNIYEIFTYDLVLFV